MGSKVLHIGDVGSGVKAKLCNNLISISTHALIAEAMILGLKSGIDLNKLYEVLKNSSAYSKTLERVVPNHFLTRNFEAKASIETIIKDLGVAFEPLSPVTFSFDRLETNPRFATISRPSNAAIVARLRIDMDGRGGRLELLLPYATLEPVRELLLQMFALPITR